MSRLAPRNSPTDGEQNLTIHRAAKVPNAGRVTQHDDHEPTQLTEVDNAPGPSRVKNGSRATQSRLPIYL
jgi:hypothetical protein